MPKKSDKKKQGSAKRDTFALFDTVFKKLIRLSGRAVISFINGLFGTSYPKNAAIEYINTETVSANLKRRISDSFLRVNGAVTYHFECQSTVDGAIILRIFESGYGYGRDEKSFSPDGIRTIRFPFPKIIQIQGRMDSPQVLRLIFPDGKRYDYKVDVFNLLEHDVAELEEQGLALLFPFYVLKLRKAVEKAKTHEELQALAGSLKGLIDELLEATDRCAKKGIIEKQDALQIFERLGNLYNEIYSRYKELVEGENTMKLWSITEEVKKEDRQKIAANFLAEGISTETIARCTHLPLSKIKRLAAKTAPKKKTARGKQKAVSE